jgi:hypothetical protein
VATIVGVFDNRNDVQCAIDGIADVGIDRCEISVVMRNWEEQEPVAPGLAGSTEAIDEETIGEGPRLPIGISVFIKLRTPDTGWVLAAGPLAATLGSTGFEIAAGPLVDALIDMGVAPEDARMYRLAVAQGGILLVLWAERDQDRISAVMNKYNVRSLSSEEQMRESNPDFQYSNAVHNRLDKNIAPAL